MNVPSAFKHPGYADTGTRMRGEQPIRIGYLVFSNRIEGA
jgi:hypothetical protein